MKLLELGDFSSLHCNLFCSICSVLSGDHDRPHKLFVNLSLFYWQDMVER